MMHAMFQPAEQLFLKQSPWEWIGIGMDYNSATASGSTGTDAARTMETVRKWSHTLDEAFHIPGTKIRFGWDPLVGLIPGLGGLFTGVASLFILVQAFRLRVPHIIKARMILNVLIDVLTGAVPVIGDIFDFAWKSHSMNFALLEKHAGKGAKPGIGDWAFVLGTAATALVILAIPVILLILLLGRLDEWIGRPPFWTI